jgi:membrane-associated phospholipid phosphatase
LFFYWDKWDLYVGIFGVFVAYAVTLLFTGFFWYFVGGLRPHFLTLCNVDWSRVTSTSIYYTTDICRNKQAITKDTFHGFPSGHASTAFAGASFLSAYLAAHFRLWRNGNVFKFLLVLLPFVYAIWLTFNRLMDFHHSLLQLTVGIFIGIFAGLLSYRIFYRHGFLLGYGKWAHIPFLWYK